MLSMVPKFVPKMQATPLLLHPSVTLSGLHYKVGLNVHTVWSLCGGQCSKEVMSQDSGPCQWQLSLLPSPP